MAAIDFPSGLTPNTRTYKLGSFPVSEFKSMNGATTFIRFGTKVVDSELIMTFLSVPDAKAYEIHNNYLSVNGGFDENGARNYVRLGTTVSEGPVAGIKDDSLRGVISENRGNRRYRYAEPPVITSTFPGLCNVAVRLQGYVDGA